MILLNDIWAVLPGTMIGGEADRDGQPEMQISNGTAVIAVVGPTTKYGRYGTTSTTRARQQLREATASPAVESTFLLFDTPGGQVAGSDDFARDVRAASQIKPTFAYASDMMASAGYNVASQAGRIFANPTAFVGSIGVMSTLVDISKLAASNGVKVHPITSGGMKGMGIPGTEITQDHIAYQQSRINQVAEQFVQNVATGRAMPTETARSLADGRLHIAEDAQRLGLIDGVMALDEAIGTLQSFTRQLKG